MVRHLAILLLLYLRNILRGYMAHLGSIGDFYGVIKVGEGRITHPSNREGTSLDRGSWKRPTGSLIGS